MNTHLAEAAKNNNVTLFTDAKRNAIYKTLRQSAAMASGLEAMAVRALEVGESTEQDLENIADLSSALQQELNRISIVINEITGS